ncbi:DNA/RNA non-specific endonuclease [Jeotgalibaca caeni]|uniref:DNA/RNA non-specific endonuclease n=1 Tax=Jeotgalibaca caeni TaxID=3028623 RepID=UPI00237DE076|nr:DNA/RNA non-specific endonuclease [Jeotgalibaca caeni]MDE1548887.1 DNA/RNA non-specific endonuclease [Jeotgalibaca caeni]
MARGRKRKDELDVPLKVVNGVLAIGAVLFLLMTQPIPVIEGWIDKVFMTHTIPESELTYLEYDGVNQVVEINDNMPTFTDDELSLDDGSWQEFSEIDHLNRVGPGHAMLGTDLFPTEEREPLYIDPTGWKQKKLDNGQWLYNRSHLIGFQLTGENNNIRNLMTGTRSLNNPHMLRFENDIDYYLEQTNNHVRYLVEPIFREDELVARGVHMMAQSVEDDALRFNVYIFNIQEGYEINYQDGSSKKVVK